MTSICFYFQVHQPFRLKPYHFTEIGEQHFYEDYQKNKDILDKVATKCYLPTNQKMLELIRQHKGKFRISYSISGVALEQFEQFRPDVLASFKELADTGCVEFLSETHFHSLSYLFSKDEFHRQIMKHYWTVRRLLGVTPSVFRNTELIFNNELAKTVAEMGFKGMVAEGVDRILEGRTPNHVYNTPGNSEFGLLLKNYKLSDDIAFRFSNPAWEEHPLTVTKYASWLHSHAGEAEIINLFMDYETFGEHQWEDSGIFEFLQHLPEAIMSHPDFQFRTPSEILTAYPARDSYDAPYFTSWADTERDLSAWMENKMQQHAMHRVYGLEKEIKLINDPDLLNVWSRLQTSDHFYYMSTKYWSDGDVHKYFSPYESPYDAHIYYMNVLSDLEKTIQKSLPPCRISKRKAIKAKIRAKEIPVKMKSRNKLRISSGLTV